MTGARTGYRPEIDGLRALAVLVVIVNHFSKTLLPSGFLGVDIFFVISGYVITGSLADKHHDSLKTHLLGFMARRMKRLLPALLFCIVASCAVGFLFIPASYEGFQAEWRSGVAALFGLSNMYLLRRATDYFSSSAELNLFTHTWSLGVEEQFYLVFPTLAWASGFAQGRPRGSRNFFVLIVLLSAGSLLGYLWLNRSHASAAYFLMPARFWELGVGCLTFLALQADCPPLRRLLAVLPPLPIVIAVVALLFTPQTAIQRTTPALVALTSMLIAALAGRPATLAGRLLGWGPIVFVGLASYSIYLWHWPVLCIARWTIGIEPRTIPVLSAIIVLVAVFSYQHVERRLRSATWAPRPGGTLGLGLAAALSCAVLLVLLGLPLKGMLFLGQDDPSPAPFADSRQDDQVWQGRVVWRSEECVLSRDDQVGRPRAEHFCTFDSSRPSPRRFLVIGDSFSVTEIEMVKILPARGLGSVTVTSCLAASAVPEVANNSHWKRPNDYYWSAVVPGLLATLRAGDAVLMLNDMARFAPFETSLEVDEDRQNLVAGLERLATKLGDRGIGLIIQSVNSFVRDSQCGPKLARRQGHEPSGRCHYYTREASQVRKTWLQQTLAAREQSHTNVQVLDLFEVFCPGEVCGFFLDSGIALYRDEYSHPSIEAAVRAQPVLLDAIAALDRKMAGFAHHVGR